MTKTFDAIAAKQAAYDAMSNADLEKAKDGLVELIAHYEQTGNTNSMEYLNVQFDLQLLQCDLNDVPAAIQTLEKLRAHFEENIDAPDVKPGMTDLYLGSGLRLAMLQDHVGDKEAAINTLHACIPRLMDFFGEDSPHVAHAKALLKSIQNAEL